MSEVWKYLKNDEEDPYKRGIKFEKFYVKKYLKNNILFSKIYKDVLLWEEWEERPFKTDIGIDLICIGHDNTVTAVQAKAYNPSSTISKPDIDSFITASNSDLFSNRLLIGTTNKIGKNAKQIINSEKRIPFQTHLLSDLEESNFLDICKQSFKKNDIKEKFKPLPHQQEAIRKTKKHLSLNNNGQLIMACGSGKTLTSFWIAESNNARKVLFLAPSISLLAQTLKVWIKNLNNDHKEFFVVCSDNTAGKFNEQEYVSDYDFPSTTNPKQISKFLKSKKEFVIFSTYQSSKTVFKEIKKHNMKFDLTICDEAHRLTGKINDEYGSVLKKDFPTSKKLFMTATPRIISYGLKKAAEGREVELVSMDDEELFGKVIYELTFGEAIEKKLLADYKIIVTGISGKEVDNKNFIKFGNNSVDIKTYSKALSLKKALKKYKLNKVITFHSFIKSASMFSEILKSLDLNSNYISGHHSIRERKQLIKKLEQKSNNIEILSNAKVLSEGIDLPELDSIAFIDPKSSVVDIVQAVGRAIRASRDKKKIGYIIIPIYIDDPKGLETIYKTVIAMRSHDVRMAEELDNFRIKIGSGVDISKVNLHNLVIDIPTYVDKKFEIELVTNTIEAGSETWYFWYGLLKKYSETYGHSVPKSNEFFENLLLGRWVSHQRAHYKNKKLTKDKVDLLEELINWSWDPREDTFNLYYENIKKYYSTNKEPPTVNTTFNGLDLATWIINVRNRMIKNQYPKDKISLLESIPNFYWSKDDFIWNKNIKDLKTFCKREKHSYPHSNAQESKGGVHLGKFANSLRDAYEDKKKTDRKISPKQIKELEDIPYWNWMKKNEYEFINTYEKVKKILNEHSFFEIRDLERSVYLWLHRNTTHGVRNTYPNAQKLFDELEDKHGVNVKFMKSNLTMWGNQFLETYESIDNKLNKNFKLTDEEKEWILSTKKYIGKNKLESIMSENLIKKFNKQKI